MYARLCKRLAEEAPNLETPNGKCSFKDVLLNKCQDEFERRSDASRQFDQRETPLTPEEEERRQIAKKKMLGNIKFIGELGKLEILRESILHECCMALLDKKKKGEVKDMAEDLECLCQIMKTCGKILESERGKSLVSQYFARLSKLAQNPSLPTRIRFMLRDTIELRMNGWIPRKATNIEGPMLINEIRDDHRDRGGYMSSMGSQGQRMGGGGMGGRDGMGGVGHLGGGGNHVDLFCYPMSTRREVWDGGPVNPGVINLGPGSGMVSSQDFYGYGNGFQSSYRRGQQFGGPPNYGSGRQGFSNHNKQNQNQQQGFNNMSGKNDLPPRFKNKMMLAAQQGSHANLEEVSLRPAANFKPKTPNSLPKTSLSLGGRQPALEPLLPPTQPSLLAPKPPPPILHAKEQPILIKQGSLDKNKGGKKDKGPSKDEVLKKIDSMLDDFLNNSNMDEAVNSFKEQKVPDRFMSAVLTSMMNKTLEKSDTDRESVSSLLSKLKKEGLYTTTQFIGAFKELLGQMADKERAIPRIFSYVAGFAANAIIGEIMSLAEVAELCENGAHYPLFLLVLQQLNKTQGKAELTKLFNDSKVNLLNMLPEIDKTKEKLADILEDKGLTFLFPLLRIQAELWKQLKANPNPNAFYKWIKENLDPSHHQAPGFINALVTVLVKYITQETTLPEGAEPGCLPDKALQEKEKYLLEKFNPVLQAFLQNEINLQVVAVYALQVYCYSKQFPKGMLLRWFVYLYDLEIVEEDAFMKWKEDISDDYPGKGKALFQVHTWLTWLYEAEAESEEEDEGDS
ncbi:eukaryotic translation initiation factor 4 gamma 2 isoform X1 [Ischnura elegans]|uniref:eukaryotic translation initiation factor 4 gamma 2 isoform X1 n=1 Tax=Ischnura elegans TaxID=197161 RepID=UPI001ED89608|nr:eukaryotic translation initiation factor 4 gamma 2 isoform X1 [Ischnura elegans]